MQSHHTSSARPDAKRRVYPNRLFAVVGVAVALHLNYWLWDADGLVLGLPVNLFYQVLLTLALSGVMFVLVRRHWPSFLDDDDDPE